MTELLGIIPVKDKAMKGAGENQSINQSISLRSAVVAGKKKKENEKGIGFTLGIELLPEWPHSPVLRVATDLPIPSPGHFLIQFRVSKEQFLLVLAPASLK